MRKLLVLWCLLPLLWSCDRRADASTIPELIQSLNSSDTKAQNEGLVGLLKHGRDAAPAIPALVAFIRMNTGQARNHDVVMAFDVLSNTGEAGLSALRDLIEKEPNVEIRRLAASYVHEVIIREKNLGHDVSDSGVELLNDATKQSDSEVRRFAAQGLAFAAKDISIEKAVPRLIELLQDESRSVRKQAALALGRVGPAAKAAVPILTEAVQDPNSGYWDEASGALAAINATPTER